MEDCWAKVREIFGTGGKYDAPPIDRIRTDKVVFCWLFASCPQSELELDIFNWAMEQCGNVHKRPGTPVQGGDFGDTEMGNTDDC